MCAYSTIKRKKCKCNEFCDKWPTMGWQGYFMGHAPQELREKQTKKQVETRNRQNKAKLSRLVHEQANLSGNEISSSLAVPIHPQSQQWAWFVERRKEMLGMCIECGKMTQKNNDKYFHWNIAHITPKSLVPSVATNEYNWVELCWLHHQEFDAGFDRAANMMCFGEAKLKFQLFKKEIPDHEMRKVNPHLLT